MFKQYLKKILIYISLKLSEEIKVFNHEIFEYIKIFNIIEIIFFYKLIVFINYNFINLKNNLKNYFLKEIIFLYLNMCDFFKKIFLLIISFF